MAETLIQREKIIAVIEAEQRLVGGTLADRHCGNPGHCAVGALLFAAGWSDRQLTAIRMSPIVWRSDNRAARALKETYGLSTAHVRTLVTANDDVHDTMDNRRACVIATVRRLREQKS